MRHFKLFLLLLLVLTKNTSLFSQTKADSISLTFPKVLVINDKKQVLLGYDNNRKAYEVPSIGTIRGPISFTTYLDKTAKDMGIKYQTFRLGGLFTYIFPNEYSTFIRPYFVVKFIDYFKWTKFSRLIL